MVADMNDRTKAMARVAMSHRDTKSRRSHSSLLMRGTPCKALAHMPKSIFMSSFPSFAGASRAPYQRRCGPIWLERCHPVQAAVGLAEERAENSTASIARTR